jgi:hypothetical protein
LGSIFAALFHRQGDKNLFLSKVAQVKGVLKYLAGRQFKAGFGRTGIVIWRYLAVYSANNKAIGVIVPCQSG